MNIDVYTSQLSIDIGKSIENKDVTDKESPICFKEYENPKELLCSHCICEKCLNQIYNSPELENNCPICRTSFI